MKTDAGRRGRIARAVLILSAIGLGAVFIPRGLRDRDLGDGNDAQPAGSLPSTLVETPRDDPLADGWDTEVFWEASDRVLRGIGSLIESGSPSADSAGAFVSAGYSSAPLRLPGLVEVFRDPAFTVRRAANPDPAPPAGAHRGAAGFAKALEELLEPFRGGRDIHAKWKTFRVELPPGDAAPGARARTKSYFLLTGETPEGPLQMTATWALEWTASSPATPPVLESIAVESHEETTASKGLFADCTEASLGGNAIFDAQIRPGADHWTARIDASLGIDIGGWQGVAVADVNGDGLDDVYACQPGGLPNRLFLRGQDGTAAEAAAEAGVDWLDPTHAALLADMDNDGDQDLLASVDQGLLVCANDGRGRFTVAAAEVIPASIPYSLAAADHDSDGDLDVFVCGYNPRAGVSRHLLFARPVPYHDANNGAPNVLFRNDGALALTQVTRRVGLDSNNRRFSYAAAWEDYDDDGDPDLYVANDFGRDNLYRNDGGRFTDVAPALGVDDIGAGMSAAWGDYDNDGRMDIHVSNMFSSAGNRIAFQQRFHPHSSADTKSHLQRHARGNTLFRNAGEGRFEDTTLAGGVALGRWAWGSKFIDWNNDGREDLLVTNGFITQAEDKGDL
jgi:hypothetical protein